MAAVALVGLLAPPMLINMASWWEIAAIIAGILLIVLEIFVIPGFGIFGVVTYSVAARKREMGIRLALGARGADVRHLVLRRALTPVLIGLVVGINVALFSARLLSGLLFGVQGNDPATFVRYSSRSSCDGWMSHARWTTASAFSNAMPSSSSAPGCPMSTGVQSSPRYGGASAGGSPRSRSQWNSAPPTAQYHAITYG